MSSAPAAEGAAVRNHLTANTCLELPANAGWGTQLRIGACNGSASQDFVLQPDGQLKVGSWCVDASLESIWREGASVAVFYCHGSANQRWATTTSGEIKGLVGKCMSAASSDVGKNVVMWSCLSGEAQRWTFGGGEMLQSSSADDPCAIRQIIPSPYSGLTVWSPDGSQYLVNKEDAGGVAQVYVGSKDGGAPVCITCTDKVNGPTSRKMKMQPHWHPSGRWIVLAAEQENFVKPFYATPALIEGWLQSGIWVDMFVTTPDGSVWRKLQDFGPQNKADGFTGVAFTPDGKKGVWAQIVDGNILAYQFGRWELLIADFEEVNGVLTLSNVRNITPPDTYWVEPGNFSPNGKDLLLSADQGFVNHAQVEGQDQYILDITTGQMTNLTNSPTIWDEHGRFSPDGKKIIFMSSYGYRAEPTMSKTLNLKTEFMMMDGDGTNLRQVSHFNVPGYAESSTAGSVAANGEWSPDGSTFSGLNLFFPKYKSWEIQFNGNCGR
ncbi:MAG TPA: ricin-type beta-trefoil lectin domain protein [Bryobacteraceae bacterium]|nr:ricin-type beta-trefoil lectin domain protein [Bryobacteraceae bacterium]